jgi:hypothetical protein
LLDIVNMAGSAAARGSTIFNLNHKIAGNPAFSCD